MIEEGDSKDSSADDMSRREFNALLLGAGAAIAGATTSAAASAPLPVTEKDVQVKTHAGTADAVFIAPMSGVYPGVLIWVDAFGVRPAFRTMGRRLAAEGYSVLVPNPYYRTTRDPHLLPGFSFKNTDDRAKLMGLMGSLSPEAIQEDAVAYVDFLDAQPQIKKTVKIGTQGYCMGGPLTIRAAAARPDRIGAGASFHGGGLVTDKPDSPHLLIPKMKARFYVGIASNDDKSQPDAKEKLKTAFAEAKLPAQIEVYDGALHGWCLPDIPSQDGTPIYNQVQADRAWSNLLALYKATLI